MKTTKMAPRPVADHVSRPPGVEERIRCRAYQIYEERGKFDGHDVEDWLVAEEEIIGHQVRRKVS